MNALTITDPVYEKTERTSLFERVVLPLIIDRRDLPFVRLTIFLSALMFGSAAYLAWPGHFRWWLAVIYLAIYGIFLGPYVLMLHNTSHRKLFQRRFDFLNVYIPWVLGPLFGESPSTYYMHHVEMHHKENNLPGDLSSTMKYERDSIFAFLSYFCRFFFLVLGELSMYFAKQGRHKLMMKTLAGEISFALMMVLLLRYDWRVGLTVFVLPFCITRFAMMAGNWAQHAFIDETAPENNYKNSITCINSSYNRRCFNDGYHIGHHLRRTRHWTEMPGEFLENRAKYAAEGAIVFSGVDFFVVWFFLMMKRYDWLAAHYVELGDETHTQEEIEALLKKRTRPIAIAETVDVQAKA